MLREFGKNIGRQLNKTNPVTLGVAYKKEQVWFRRGIRQTFRGLRLLPWGRTIA